MEHTAKIVCPLFKATKKKGRWKSKQIFSFFLLCILVFSSLTSFSQTKKKRRWADLIDTTARITNGMLCDDFIYKPYIRTVQLHDVSFELSQPILSLESDEKLILSFDDLDADNKNYMYTLIHCTSDWKPDDLSTSDYIDGFPDNVIIDYKYSINTIQSFTHYSVSFPNDNMKITKSGNYILKVYQDSKPDNLVLTKRFMVFQNKVSVEARVKPASIIEYRTFKQEIDFSIFHTEYAITDPYQDLKVVITQNNRWDNAKTNLKPLFVKDDELVYDYDDVNVFDGGSEFRVFDIKSIRYHSERIRNIYKDTLGVHVELQPDEKRSFKRYSSAPDMNGNYIVKIQEGTYSNVEADYCSVTFFIPFDNAISDGKLYVAGAFNDWKYLPENEMKFNPKRFGYECTLYLKQGYYNYEYMFIYNNEPAPDQTFIEGMHQETENDYTIYVYHHPVGTFYDQLIGVKRLNSIKNR